MSSHREAPQVCVDPLCDSTDLYCFVSPDRPDTVTIIANYVPLQLPSGGPNFYEFGNDVLYEIHIDNDGDGRADISYQFRFDTKITNKNTFLYNTGPITSLTDKDWNRRQTYSVTRVSGGRSQRLASGLACPPCNIGPASTPNYTSLVNQAIFNIPGGRKVFCGQRAEGFYVDLGAAFDLADLRPFRQLHAFGMKIFDGPGKPVNATDGLNVHSIALQVPISDLIRGDGKPKADDPRAVVGVWTSATRRQVRLSRVKVDTDNSWAGPLFQVSRLANPLFNEVIVPMARKDEWNHQRPFDDKEFAKYVANPELANLLPVLFPGVFPNLAKLNAAKTSRADLLAIFLTGIPSGLIPGFQNFTGNTQAEMMRLNTAIKPTAKPSPLGLLGGDLAGYPNGRRVADDTVAISLKAVAGATYALVDKTYKVDDAVQVLDDGVTANDVSAPYLNKFPYLGTPYSGYNNPS
jgi:Domain of unknown function (DUF4331)